MRSLTRYNAEGPRDFDEMIVVNIGFTVIVQQERRRTA